MSPPPQLRAASPPAFRFNRSNDRPLNDGRSHHDDRVTWWHLIAHAAAFCAATVIAAVVFYPYYPELRYRTDSAGEAFGAFLTLCVIFGGLGPPRHPVDLCHAAFGCETPFRRFAHRRPQRSLAVAP
jgi:hypothetical protein